jgi:hypothetical protein
MMAAKVVRFSAVTALLGLSACSFASNALWPSLGGGGNANQTQTAGVQRATATAPVGTVTATPVPAPPALGTTSFIPPAVTQGANTGTFVGAKVAQHRGELIALQDTIIGHNQQLQQVRQQTTEDSQRYHGTIAAINSRLQIGTTPGNPVLLGQWRSAQGELERLSADVANLNSLANSVASDSAMASYLLEAARATYGLAGAIDEDHRQLAILEDETNRTVVLIDRLLNELSEDISRQTAYLSAERRNLQTIAIAIQNGEILGQSLFNRAFANAAAPVAAPQAAAIAPPVAGPQFGAAQIGAGEQPLVVIRFDRPNVQYQQPLYNAVAAALERKPTATFDLMAVASAQGNAANMALNVTRAKQNAEEVLRTLTDMGLPADRVRLSSTSTPDVTTNEVRIFVR